MAAVKPRITRMPAGRRTTMDPVAVVAAASTAKMRSKVSLVKGDMRMTIVDAVSMPMIHLRTVRASPGVKPGRRSGSGCGKELVFLSVGDYDPYGTEGVLGLDGRQSQAPVRSTWQDPRSAARAAQSRFSGDRGEERASHGPTGPANSAA